jgi:hypothetical protein
MWSTLGWGSSSSRRPCAQHPSSRRASTSAWRPACSIEASASRVDAWLGAQRVALGAGLDDHHADVVGHEVVQLARDAGALLGHRLVRAQLVLALEQLGARGERVGAQLAPADRAADEHHRERSAAR